MKFPDQVEFLRNPRLLSLIAILGSVVLLFYYYYLEIIPLALYAGNVVLYPHLPSIAPYFAPAFALINVLTFLAGSAAIFLISREFIFTERYKYFITSGYLLYFPLSGINWSVFTVLNLFPTLFLLAYYAYLMDRRLLSALLFLISAATFQVYAIVVAITGIGIMSHDTKSGILARQNGLGISLLVISILMILTVDLHTGLMGYYQAVNTNGYGSLLAVIKAVTFSKPLFFIILLVPMITYGFFGPRVLPITIPLYILGVPATVAGGSPEALVAIVCLAVPLSIIWTVRWIGKKVEMGILANDRQIIRFALFSLILLNIMVILTYVPFLSILARLLGI